jgi:hypothetical protein
VLRTQLVKLLAEPSLGALGRAHPQRHVERHLGSQMFWMVQRQARLFLPPPDDAAEKRHALARNGEIDLIGHCDQTLQLYPGSGAGKVANDAVDRRFAVVEGEAAAVVDPPAKRATSFLHR